MLFFSNLVRRIIGIPRIYDSLLLLHKKLDIQLEEKNTKQGSFSLSGTTFETRKIISATFLKGSGIEIGAFASPLEAPSGASVTYIDKYNLDALDASHKIAGLTLADFGVDIASIIRPDIVDDGECLTKIGDYSQDFVIANHVLEHFEDPIKGFKNMLRVLKHNGILYLSLPEMRHSFDQTRQPTPFSHILRDYESGPAWSRDTAYAEFAKIFAAHGMDKGLFPRCTGQRLKLFEDKLATELNQANFSIHFHAWTMDGMLDMFLNIKRVFKISFEMKLAIKNNDEVVFVFQKTVPHVG